MVRRAKPAFNPQVVAERRLEFASEQAAPIRHYGPWDPEPGDNGALEHVGQIRGLNGLLDWDVSRVLGEPVHDYEYTVCDLSIAGSTRR